MNSAAYQTRPRHGIADGLGVSKVDVDGVVSFYHFFSKEPRGKYTVYLNNSAVAVMKGRDAVARAFEQAAGCSFGVTTFDGQIGLYDTSGIGMNDQEPSALINGVVFTSLTPEKAKDLVFQMKAGKDVRAMVKETGDGQNQSDLIHAMVNNNIRKEGPVLFAPFEAGLGDQEGGRHDARSRSSTRSRNPTSSAAGGAGFPTGMKWEFCRKQRARTPTSSATPTRASPGPSRTGSS